MQMNIFNGHEFVADKVISLKKRVAEWGREIKIVSLCFDEDVSSKIYANKKQLLAGRIGINFQIINLNFNCPIIEIKNLILKLSNDKSVTGIMVQKPRKSVYNDQLLTSKQIEQLDFVSWWRKITELLPIEKDVDGLSPLVIEKLRKKQNCLVLPATAKAILEILATFNLRDKRILLIGKSDIIGWPLYWQWKNQGLMVEIVGKNELAKKLSDDKQLKLYQVVVSATGVSKLIKGEMLAEDVILVDVGEPKSDFDFESCVTKAKFITPVPGGVGPVTVWALLENSLTLSQFNREF